MNWKKEIDVGTVCILIAVFGYTGVAKTWGYESSLDAFLNQPFPNEWGKYLSIAVPATELITVFFLLFRITRMAGLVLGLVLMTAFTTYTGLVWIGAFDRIPCSCGGIFSRMGWEAHTAVNAAITILIGLTLWVRSEDIHQPYSSIWVERPGK